MPDTLCFAVHSFGTLLVRAGLNMFIMQHKVNRMLHLKAPPPLCDPYYCCQRWGDTLAAMTHPCDVTRIHWFITSTELLTYEAHGPCAEPYDVTRFHCFVNPQNC
jgi:hypothetical protein